MTGPFKINGVPLRRVNARYVIATSTKVDLSGVDSSTLDKVSGEDYFVREKKSSKEKSEESFFKQGEKPEVRRTTDSEETTDKTDEHTEEEANLCKSIRPEIYRQANP